MRMIQTILICVLLSCIALGQNDKEGARAQLDSMRQLVLIPKLKLYNQRVEKITKMISSTKDKRCVKQYAKNLVQVSETFQDAIASLYDCGLGGRGRGSVSVGIGFGPWFYPGFGGYMYGYPYDGYGFGYDCLPPLFYDVEKVRGYAKSIRLRSTPANVSRKLEFIDLQLDLLKKIEKEKPGEASGVSVR